MDMDKDIGTGTDTNTIWQHEQFFFKKIIRCYSKVC